MCNKPVEPSTGCRAATDLASGVFPSRLNGKALGARRTRKSSSELQHSGGQDMGGSPAREALKRYTIRELLILAEAARVQGRSKLTKDQLIEELVQRGYRPRGDLEDPSFRKAAKIRLLNLVDKLSVAPTSTADRLTINPVEADDAGGYAAPLFEEVEVGTIAVEETKDGGAVPELCVTKTSPGRTILVEGEPLVGGNQDRVLSTTIIIEGPGKVVVPVTCIEAGRWAFSTARFSSSGYHSYYSSRSLLSRSLSSSLRTSSRYRSDQSGIWRDIAFSLGTSGTGSRTHRMSDIFEEHKEKVERYQKELGSLPKQVGYHASIDGVPVAFEMFGSHETFAKYWPKLLNGLAIEAMVSPNIRTRNKRTSRFRRASIAEVLRAAVLETYQSIGKGRDVRITGRRCHGSALLDGDRVEHWILHWG